MTNKKNPPATRSLKRKLPKATPHKKFYIFCEGKNTEPAYFNALFRDLRINKALYDIEIHEAVGVPQTILRQAKSMAKATKKSGFTNEFWAVFDKDEVPDGTIKTVIREARDSNIQVGFSNPCFEIWAVLHIDKYSANVHRHDLQRWLKARMPKYDHEKKAIIDYAMIADSREIAKKRAKELLDSHKDCGAELANPSTTVYKLVESLESSRPATEKTRK